MKSKTIPIILISALFHPSAHAALLAGWHSHAPAMVTYPLQAHEVDNSAISSAEMRYEGLIATNDERTIFWGWGAQKSIDVKDDYLEFSLFIHGGMRIELEKLRLTAATLTGLDLDVRSSTDGYSSSLGVIDLTVNYQNYYIDLGGLEPVEELITFRLYGLNSSVEEWDGFYGLSASQYPGFIDGEGGGEAFFAVFGTATQVPEPTITLLSAFGALSLLRRKRYGRRYENRHALLPG